MSVLLDLEMACIVYVKEPTEENKLEYEDSLAKARLLYEEIQIQEIVKTVEKMVAQPRLG